MKYKNITLVYNTMSGITVPFEYKIDLDDITKFMNEISDVYKYFEGHFTKQEIKWLGEHKQELYKEIDVLKDTKNKVRDKKRKIARIQKKIDFLDKNVLNVKGPVKRQVLNDDTYTTEFEGLQKISENTYEVYWGT